MIRPTKGRVLIRKKQDETTTVAGIEIVQHAKTSQNTTTSTGTVEAVGPSSELSPSWVVVFDEGWGNEVENGLYLVDEANVKAVLV